MNYNVKTIEYVDSVQVRTYKRPVTSQRAARVERIAERVDIEIAVAVSYTHLRTRNPMPPLCGKRLRTMHIRRPVEREMS